MSCCVLCYTACQDILSLEIKDIIIVSRSILMFGNRLLVNILFSLPRTSLVILKESVFRIMASISMMGSPKNLSETFLPNGINGIKDARKVTVGVIGSGDFAKSLTIRLIRCGYHVVIGSRNPKFASEFFPHVVDVTHHEDALTKTNIIFVAIHREHYTSLWDLRHLLVGKILIDVSNNMRINQYPESNAEYLASLFPDSLIVKGFNVVSAWTLQLGPKDASRQVCIFNFHSCLSGMLYLSS